MRNFAGCIFWFIRCIWDTRRWAALNRKPSDRRSIGGGYCCCIGGNCAGRDLWIFCGTTFTNCRNSICTKIWEWVEKQIYLPGDNSPRGALFGASVAWSAAISSLVVDPARAFGCPLIVPGTAGFPRCFGLRAVVCLGCLLFLVSLVPLTIFSTAPATQRLLPQHFTTSLRRFWINTIVRRSERLVTWWCFCDVATLTAASNETVY